VGYESIAYYDPPSYSIGNLLLILGAIMGIMDEIVICRPYTLKQDYRPSRKVKICFGHWIMGFEIYKKLPG
jgi:hypothetical protein